jgi:hypothetical protein
VTWTNPPAGTNFLTAVAVGNDGLSTTSAVVSVILDIPPTVTLTNPVNNAAFVIGSNIKLGAIASDADGTVTQVQFFAGTTSLGIDTNAPYSLTWSNVASGTYALTAIATDNNGITTTSATANVVVDAPPSVAITSPTNTAVILLTVTTNPIISATASDSVGICQVQFFTGANSLGVAATAPYSVTANDLPVGTNWLTAVAVGNDGLSTTSAVVIVTIVGVPPSVTLTNPANNAVFAVGSNINLGAVASDADGTVTKVQFFAGTTSLGIDASAPYGLTWSNAASGTYALKAVATDNHSITSTSATVNVVIDTPPAIAITSPTNGTLIAAPASVTINASASDSDGTVKQVQFFAGTTSLGIDTNAPYSVTWNNPSPGIYALTAVATDNAGLSTTSPAIAINVLVVGADPDGDGLNNLQEYLYGSNPNVSDGFWLWVNTPSGLSGTP